MKKNAMKIRKLAFTGLLVIGTVTTLSQVALKAEARPCGSGLLDRIGCKLDPTNPASNDGELMQALYIQPYLTKLSLVA